MTARGLGGKYQGMNWIRKEKRLAVYLRDGLACVWGGNGIEDSAQLTLDHLVCYSKGGTHKANNLVTACKKCNSSRGNRAWVQFAIAVAEYVDHGVQGAEIVGNIDRLNATPINVEAAKDLITRRGGFRQSIEGAI